MTTFAEIRVPDPESWKPVDDEIWREYLYPDMRVRVEGHVALKVSGSGGHYLICEDDTVSYVPPGFRKLIWKIKSGEQHAAF